MHFTKLKSLLGFTDMAKKSVPAVPEATTEAGIIATIKNHFDDIISEYDKKSEIVVDGPVIDNGAYALKSVDLVDITSLGTIAAFNRTCAKDTVTVVYGLGAVRGETFIADKIFTTSVNI